MREILDARGGPVLPPIRAEIFGPWHFARHGRSLGGTHRAGRAGLRPAAFFPRLDSNIRTLHAAHRYIGAQAVAGYDVSPAAEWLLDNFHLVQAQIEQIRQALPRNAVRALPVLRDEALAGLPRIYGVAWAMVAHTDSAFDEDLLVQYLGAYQEARELTLRELWALPTTLRVLLIENLRRLAEREAAQMAAREVANLCCDVLAEPGPDGALPTLSAWRAVLVRRGVGTVFLAQMSQRLQEHPVAEDVARWLARGLPDPAAAQAQLRADQAADNLSMSNAVTSLRAIGDADWADIVARSSLLMQVLLGTPAFESEDAGTRDRTLHAIERLARRSGRSELAIARALQARMVSAASPDAVEATPGHWLQGPGRAALERALGLNDTLRRQVRAAWPHLALPAYLAALALGTLALLHLLGIPAAPAHGALAWLGVALALLPASEAVGAAVNRLVSEWARPARLPRLALAAGIPPEHRVMVAIPAMLGNEAGIRALAHRLHLHYLANPEPHAQFALLTDDVDADAARLPADGALLDFACAQVDLLNARHPPVRDGAPRFILLHRPRRFCATERRWIGWERKRGKLQELVTELAEGAGTAFVPLGERSRIEPGTRYLVTLDSDTELPPGRLRALVGVAAHPCNRPHLGPGARHVARGYGILQPHVVTPLPAAERITPFHWLFAGQTGIDPYSAASSEVYQDLFGEGSFSGKGLLHVSAAHAVLGASLPEDAVLSHDLFEGSLARCAAVTDVNVIEDAPFQVDVAAARAHRWTRGDWQLLPLLFDQARWPLRAVHRWKMADNLRRSLVAPASLGLLMLSLLGATVSPGAALVLVLAAFSAGPLIGAVVGFVPSRDGLARRHFIHQAGTELLRAFGAGVWGLAQLGTQALLSTDAITRTLWRLLVSRRHLLQWTPFANAPATAHGHFGVLLRRHAREPALALALGAGLWAGGTPHPGWALALCLLWAASPLTNGWASRARGVSAALRLPQAQREQFEDLARDTWRLFERCVGPDDRHLPPDNLQVLPQEAVAHRTSPTNIGLYMLSTACAREFGWIGTQELLARLEATLATLGTLQRHRGHFLNWYDTRTGVALMPAYVSTVDSGNLSGHLIAVAQACRARVPAPHDDAGARRALAASRRRLDAARGPGAETHAGPGTALATLLAMDEPLEDARRDAVHFARLLEEALSEPRPEIDADASTLACLQADHLATLRSAWLDVQAEAGAQASHAAWRLQALAHACETLAWQADFSFLYHRRRRLFHIGWRVTEQQLDAGFYDLLASESRLASLLAIAKGDVPVAHWTALGRPIFAVGTQVGLRSWSGSMFEYLMPCLVLEEPPGSVLHEAGKAALAQQQAFGTAHGVPWGASESAHAGRDHTLAYQYAPHGVPSLALRRTPPDELVIAPYATALAAQVAPRVAGRNVEALERLGARGRYGLVEALDFSGAPQGHGLHCTVVGTYMAHHQGMTVVSLANVLRDGVARRWGMADARLEAVASLLHERVPREAMPLGDAPAPWPQAPASARVAAGPREVVPGVAAVEPTQLVSNGRYHVALRANGAGWSRWGETGITRWRDDALRDACGSFFFLRWDRQPRAVSITQHPAPDPQAHYSSTFHADRVRFDATWPELQSRLTVWVSPEDDIEFRQVELRNASDRTLEIELISAFEPTLAAPRADEAHPAFGNLFLHARWRAPQQALLFERVPRLATERAMHVAHFLAEGDPQVVGLQAQADRVRWAGRNRAASQPLAQLQPLPDGGRGAPDAPDVELDTGLDPMCALGVRLRIAPNSAVRLVFATAATEDAGVLAAVIDKYRQPSHVQRASLMSATLTDVRSRALHLNAEHWADIQTLTTALVHTLTRPQQVSAGETCDRSLLWRFGLSGERPILLVMAGAPQGLGMLRSLVRALHVWSWGGVACDLVVVNAEASSYQKGLQAELTALRDRLAADESASGATSLVRLHLLRAQELSVDEASTLHHLACLRLVADGRPLLHHVQEWRELHEQAFETRHGVSTAALQPAPAGSEPAVRAEGAFAGASGEFKFSAGARLRPDRPWVNVLANPRFGAIVSEAGGGGTWALNSRLNQLTAWSNDPVGDPPSEWFMLQDLATRQAWCVAPSAWACPDVTYDVAHGQGLTVIRHRRGDVEVTASWCVDARTAIKQVHLRLVNHGPRSVQLRVIGIAEWMMGASRADRATAFTAMQPLAHAGGRLLLCTQRERAAGFGGSTAFLAVAGERDDVDWTCDRRECFDARGHPVLPDHCGQQAGNGLDPCALLSMRLPLAGGASAGCVFLLGHADGAQAAQALAVRALTVRPEVRIATVAGNWDELLGATEVSTPDPLFDALVNRWLLYQTVSCRLWAKAGFYQAGGATGFRDQLQDTLALAWAAPQLLREQIVLCASRQFAEGDVQHWWHAPSGAGVRTHISDDLLWLPHALLHHQRTTGDATLLDQHVPFIEGTVIPEGAEDAYDTPRVSLRTATVYEHAALAIDRSLRVGVHGLPLMGGGDWNDGMNRVGHGGRGESVWLGWFLCALVAGFAPLARERGDVARAERWEAAAAGWQGALLGAAWDGHWFVRAFFDDGQPLGSHRNAEARIDLIAQAWAVLSGVAPPQRRREALAAVQEHLGDEDAGLLHLLDPPLVHADPSAGYLQAYPPGVRENGGQYSHGAVWALMAQAAWATGAQGSVEARDTAYRWFTWLSPAHRAAHPRRGPLYGLEPYVAAGDVCSQPPHTGRGGWSWYTGAAGWMHRAAIESIFGLDLGARTLSFDPCLPSHWPRADLTLRREGRSMRFILLRGAVRGATGPGIPGDAQWLPPRQALDWPALGPDSCFVIPVAP